MQPAAGSGAAPTNRDFPNLGTLPQINNLNIMAECVNNIRQAPVNPNIAWVIPKWKNLLFNCFLDVRFVQIHDGQAGVRSQRVSDNSEILNPFLR